ncbi:MAG: SIS domain-containing protein [Desulfococcaceae bacterium]|jgi:glucosamine--fructose-6-phosphate aminotransferase (isomerizing)|nr:SIS domain-containing protein [Desulfococcaceae bacterium]
MCGIAGIVSVRQDRDGQADPVFFQKAARQIREKGFTFCRDQGIPFAEAYMGGEKLLSDLEKAARGLKEDGPFYAVFSDKEVQDSLGELAGRFSDFIAQEARILKEEMGHLPAEDVDILAGRAEKLRDITWCLGREVCENVNRTRDLLYRSRAPADVAVIFKRINTVLNSIDRLEVRGRDSAGISLLFLMERSEYEGLADTLDKANFLDQFKERCNRDVLVNKGITLRESLSEEGIPLTALAFTYKVAAEIGSLGDNVAFLRGQIKNDSILQALVNFRLRNYSISSHTRWASVGAISEANCHPLDNKTAVSASLSHTDSGIFHVCLNGDIDNYLKLREEHEKNGYRIHQDITTDTKMIPLQIEKYLKEGNDITGAFRLAVNDFEGSHAITMHTDLAPGRLFLAQKGSGQAIFIGLAGHHYMAVSEVYGFIEETSRFLKLDGEKTVEGKKGQTRGQIFILHQDSPGGLEGIRAMYYDGTELELSEKDIKNTELTSRDIDRQGFPHYFLKEISESPVSVEKTLQNRWKILDSEKYAVSLDEKTVPSPLREAFAQKTVRRIFFVGQGTAGVAAQACADILNYYMNNPALMVTSLKASELSGFQLGENEQGMRDTLVVAISQSGTTTDTNRTVDMVRERGAHTLAIVNRRDSDLTFKVDGVMYTSSGRDIEMSVASTKAFYSQIVAGVMLSLFLARICGARDDDFVTAEIRRLLALPAHMQKVLSMKSLLENSAMRHALTRTYWAAVGSGPNKTSADEIRIKLSELCYKTISSDYVEDKKHIDLSSEPLIIVCAAGTRPTVIGDIIKDTAIFKAHKAVPLVIADEGENRFAPYAADVFHVPQVSEHLAPVLNTLAGHIWGYYAALAINEGSRFLYGFREEVQHSVEKCAAEGSDIYELILEKSFREKMARFYYAFRKKSSENGLSAAMGLNASSDLTLLLKYLSGRLPVTDFEMDFHLKGTARNMLDALFACLGTAINNMARPVDAIKHQAKTVTVGTSRLSEKIKGLLFDLMDEYGFKISQLTPSNVIVLKNIQEILSGVPGMTLYRIGGLNLLGEPMDDSTIEVVKRTGTSQGIPSRVDRDNQLKGSKRTIVQRGNVYIGKGRKDNRSILCIPLFSDSLSAVNRIEYLMLLHITFKEHIPLAVKARALGGKYEHIRNIVAENSIVWNDTYLEKVETSELFGKSAEKIGEYIVSQLK